MKFWVSHLGVLVLALWGEVGECSPLTTKLDQVHQSFLQNRRDALPSLSDPYGVPAAARIVLETSSEPIREDLHWKRSVVATVFWVGELPSGNNPTPNIQSAWDPNWQRNYGGYDSPDDRDGWNPKGFAPKLNSFYVALPYNDVTKGGMHSAEASRVIPWFWETYRGDGISVCKGRWLAIHHEGRVCYAQWEDVGPFEVNHWQYVFGDQPPRDNQNKNAGIDISPAVRDYLNFSSGGQVQWRFVNERDVPQGPWRKWRHL